MANGLYCSYNPYVLVLTSNESIEEQNIKVLEGVENRLCLCGCEELIHVRDSNGRMIFYKQGHNRRGKKKIREPMYILVHKIERLDEARSIIITQAKIMQSKDEYIEKLQKLLRDNNISYDEEY